MQIRSSAPARRPGPSKAVQARAAAAAQPARTAADSYRPSDIKVITYNTAVGNPKIKTDQKDFLTLPFYKAALENAPGAPILALQEVGNAQRDAVKAMAASGNFTVFSKPVGLRGRQNDMVVIPKRYEVLSYQSKYFGSGHLKAAAGSIWAWIKSLGKEKPRLSQLISPRSYQRLELKDTVTGKSFTFYNTHTSFFGRIKAAQNKELFDSVHQAAGKGPVIVAGDLNTRSADTDRRNDPYDKQVRAMFGDMEDMGPPGAAPDKPKGVDIDWVLAKGFESVSSKWYTGDSISLPGSPDAMTVSDHHAEENVVRFR